MMLIPTNHITVLYSQDLTEALQLYEAQETEKKTALIYNDWETIPYLSLSDNLYLGVSRKLRKAQTNRALFQLLGLDATILRKPIEELTYFQRLRLQIMQQLLRQPEQLLFLDVTEHLSIKETQDLLHYIYGLVAQRDLDVVFITQNASLATSLQQTMPHKNQD